MPYKKKIVCLANSWKHPSGKCIAGKEICNQGFGSWIRPVSERKTRELNIRECSYSNGQIPTLLDIVNITLEKAIHEGHQKENHLHNDDFYWEQAGICSWSKLQQAIDKPRGPLWYNGSSSTYGINDRVPATYVRQLKSSLYLIRPDKFTLKIQTESRGYRTSKLRVRACFEYNGEPYCIVVTDPQINQKYCKAKYTEISLQDALVCISLGEVFEDYAYKLAAGIINPF